MNKKTTPLYTLNEEGHLDFQVEEEIHKIKFQSDSLLVNNLWLVGIIAIACAIVDSLSFYQLASSFLYDSPLLRFGSIAGFFAGFEISPIYLGYAFKKREQGYRVNFVIIILTLFVFILSVAVYSLLRYKTKDLAFPDFSNAAISFLHEADPIDAASSNSTIYALVFSCLPVITSITTFLVSWYATDPLKIDLQLSEKKDMMLSSAITQIKANLVEYSDDFLRMILEEDNAKFIIALSKIEYLAAEYCDYVREKFKNHLGTPEANSALSEFHYTENEIRKIISDSSLTQCSSATRKKGDL